MATDMTRKPESRAATATLIELAGVEKVYCSGKLEYAALRGVDLSIAAEELVAIVGPSGSGKSTIIDMITGIDRPTAGLSLWAWRRWPWRSREVVSVSNVKS